ncbi:MAG: GAF domain-containing protein [Terriglobia bacterium]
MNPLRILIVDDHEPIRRGIRSLLSARPEWEICGEAGDGDEAVAQAKRLRPTLVLMDISMPRMNGLEATRVLQKELPESKVLLVSHNDPAIIRPQAESVGVPFLVKSEIAEKLLPAVEKLIQPLGAGTAVAYGPLNRTPTVPAWLAGAGDMGLLITRHDWSQTPLGPIETWPQTLKASVGLMLSSQHPMWIGWGSEATFLYNKAYIQVLSLAKHPWALGKPAAEVWAEIWDVCGPLADKVFEKGEASYVDDVRLFMKREDFFEETYYCFSYSPIRDEAGRVRGLFCPSTEVSSKVINARRLRMLSELSANAFLQKSVEDACRSAIATLAKNPDDVPFAVLYLAGGAAGHRVLRRAGQCPENLRAVAPASVELDGEAGPETLWPLRSVSDAMRREVVSIGNQKGFPLGPAQQTLSQALLAPLASRADERCRGVLVMGVSPARRLHADYLTFFDLLAGQIATAIGACTDTTARRHGEALLFEQKKVLEKIAARAPLDASLCALTDAASRLLPGARAGVVLTHGGEPKTARVVSSNVPASFCKGILGVPVSEQEIGTCSTEMYKGEPVTCEDVEKSCRWSPGFRALCLAHGIRALHSVPIRNTDGVPIGSFFLALRESHVPETWEREIGEMGAHIASIALEHDRTACALQAELKNTKRLQDVSAQMIREEGHQPLYEQIMDAAVAIMHSDFASLQVLHPERGDGGELQLLAFRGFSPEAANFWKWVRVDSQCSCGAALRTKQRVVVPDVEHCEFMAGTPDQAAYIAAGMYAVQSTPLLSREGKVLGMISTHWRVAHQPSTSELRLFEILVREAADFIERRQAEQELRVRAEELAEFNRLMVGREERMIELKKEVNELRRQLGQAAPYPLEFENEGADRA